MPGLAGRFGKWGAVMRKFWVLPLAALLVLAVAAPVSAGANTSNTSGSGSTVYGEWYGEGVYGYAYLGQEKGQPGFGQIYQESGTWVLCPPPEPAPAANPKAAAIGPLDTGGGEEFYGFQGTRTYGFTNDVTITLSRRLETGTATGSVELWTAVVDECAGIYGDDPVYELAELSVVLTGVGDLGMFRGSGSYQVPSQFNGHYNYRGKERQATGSVLAGSISANFNWAYMSQISWSLHINS